MAYLILLVLDNVDDCPIVLDAWEALGVSGVTIVESTGLGRIRAREAMRDDLPLMPSLRTLLQSREENHRTLFTVVESEEQVEALIAAVQHTVGSLAEPNQGVLFVLPVVRAVGLRPVPGDS